MSLSATSSPNTGYQNLEVAYQAGNYQLNGGKITEEKLNQNLKANGILAKGGNFFTTSGFELTSGHNGAATEFGGSTPLPDVTGPNADLSSLRDKSMWMAGMSEGALMWHAISEMARLAMREMKDAKDLKRAMGTAKIDAKQAQINATEKQIEAERDAAAEAFTTACITAIITAVISCVGAKIGGDWGNAITGIASSVGNVAQKYGEMESKTDGAQAKADEQKLVAKRYERQEAIMDSAIDEAKSNYEDAKEQFKLAMRILTEHMERQTQVVQKVTSA